MEALEWLLKWLTLIVAILAAIAAIIRYWRIIKRKFLRPAWAKVIKPGFKVLAAPLCLIVPVALIIYGWMYWASDFYAEAPAFLLTDPYAFVTFIFYEASSVSAYALFWGCWLGPFVRRRVGYRGAVCTFGAHETLADSQPAVKTGEST